MVRERYGNDFQAEYEGSIPFTRSNVLSHLAPIFLTSKILGVTVGVNAQPKVSKMNEISDANRTTAMGLLTDAKEMLAAAKLLHDSDVWKVHRPTYYLLVVRI